MSNRLSSELSPYLKQHAENPVDWYPWGVEAFERASAEDKPVFLSIGYSSCHWCHVMAHESFENESVASILNRSFISVKLDREERPDVDESYMTFVQMLTGRGGWPMSIFLMPDKAPFYGGTYFPLEDRGKHPGFRTMLLAVERLWKEQRQDLVDAAQYYSGALGEAVHGSPASVEGPVEMDSVLDSLYGSFDEVNGGFSVAPKFPPHAALELLLSLDPADPMALKTLEEMARGGIHDHVGGGFHRYSTDGEWRLPHFEKMLYDNALLLKAFSLAGSFKSVQDGTIFWMERELQSPEGLYYSALDADSEGEEGKFYVWRLSELLSLSDGEAFAEAYQCKRPGNFYDEATGLLTGENVLHLGSHAQPFPEQLKVLLSRREQRVRPQLDDKALIGWNGLAISGLVAAGRLDLAKKCAEAILGFEKGSGQLPRYVSNGQAIGEGFLEDYAYLALGLFDLGFHADALRIGEEMVRRFYDEQNGGFFSSTEDHEILFGRSKSVFDQPIPSPNSVAIRVLVRMGDLGRAEKSLTGFSGWMSQAPMACEGLFLAKLEFERVGGLPAVRFKVVGFGKQVVEIAAQLPDGWNLNPLADGSLIRGTLGGRSVSVEIVQGGEVAAFDGELVIEYQLCSDRACLPVELRTIQGSG